MAILALIAEMQIAGMSAPIFAIFQLATDAHATCLFAMGMHLKLRQTSTIARGTRSCGEFKETGGVKHCLENVIPYKDKQP